MEDQELRNFYDLDIPINFIKKQPADKQKITLPKTVLKMGGRSAAAQRKRRGLSQLDDHSESVGHVDTNMTTTFADMASVMQRGRQTEMADYTPRMSQMTQFPKNESMFTIAEEDKAFVSRNHQARTVHPH